MLSKGTIILITLSLACISDAKQLRSHYDKDCPKSEEIYPCYCSADQHLTSVDCENFSSLEKLKGILANIKEMNVSIGLWKSRLGDIPSDLFQGQKATNLHFENCQIGSFGDRPFTGLENTLSDLYIYGSVNKRRKDLETMPLSHLRKLKSFYFQANDIKKLGNEWFQGGPLELEHLSLEANDIEELGDKAFASLVNIREIWLGDNSYKVVARSMFPRPATKLTELEMSFSGIQELPEDIFVDMPSLRMVNVAGNNLRTLPEATWTVIWDQLHELYIQRNYRMECNEEVEWIYKRRLPAILEWLCNKKL